MPGSSGAFTSSIFSGGSDSATTLGGIVSRATSGGVTSGLCPPHAARARTVAARKALRSRRAHRIVHSLERQIHLGVAVRGGHERRLEWRWREIDAALERLVEKTAKD